MKRVKRIWCEHCKADLLMSNVRSCLRKPCKAKEELPDFRKVWK